MFALKNLARKGLMFDLEQYGTQKANLMSSSELNDIVNRHNMPNEFVLTKWDKWQKSLHLHAACLSQDSLSIYVSAQFYQWKWHFISMGYCKKDVIPLLTHWRVRLSGTNPVIQTGSMW